jgi:translocation and assembly module TamB
MAPVFNPRNMFRKRPLTTALSLLVLVVVLAAVYARYWITTDSGRDFVISQIDGREVAGYGKLSARNLSGDPLSEFELGSIEIRDASGTWLTASNIRLDWSPSKLLSHTVDLSDLKISDVSVLRRPVREPRASSGGKAWGVRLGKAEIDRLFLAEGVAGPESASGVNARFLNARNGSVDAQLQITPLEGAGDRIDARILREAGAEFGLEVDAIIPAGGVFAHLLELPEDASAILSANAAGDLNDGRGEARLTVDGSDKVFLNGKIEKGTLDASLRMDASALPLPIDLAEFLGPKTEADLTAQFTKKSVAFSINSRIAAGTVNVEGVSKPNRVELTAPAKVTARLASLSPFWNAPREVFLDGTVEQLETGLEYSGRARLAVRPDAGLPFVSVSGPITVSLQGGRIPFTADVVVEGPFASNTNVSDIVGKTVGVTGNGVFDLASRRLVIDAAEVTHGSGTAQMLGDINLSDNTLNLSGKVTQAIAALPGGFGGTASGFAQAKGRLRDIELGLNLNLSDLTTRIETLKPFVQGRGSLRGILQIKPGTGSIRRLEVQLPGATGQVSGRIYGPASPDLKITAKQLKTLEVSGNRIDLGDITARLTRQSGNMFLDASSENGNAVIGGRSVSDLSATAELLIDGSDLSGPVTVTGQSEGHPSTVSFLLDRSGSTTNLNAIAGRLGGIEVSGSVALADNGELDANLDAQANEFEFAGISFGSLKLVGRGARDTGSPFDVGATFDARDIQLTPGLLIDHVSGTLTTAPDGYRFEGRMVESQTRANSDVEFSGLVALSNEPTSGSLALKGVFLGSPIATRKDIEWTLGNAPTLDADISLLSGRLQTKLRPGNEATSSTLELQKLSIAPLLAALGYPEIDAIVSGTANGRLFGENPIGKVRMTATSGVSGVDTALDLKLNGQLDRNSLTLTAESTYGPELKANAAGRLPVVAAAGTLVKFDQDRPVEGMADITGDLSALRLIALAYGHDVGGKLKSRAAVSGTLTKPVVESTVQISNGKYEYGATGLNLKDVNVKAGYADRILTITGDAAGVEGGTLKVSGRLAESEAGMSVKFDRLRVYDRLGDNARISGDATLTEGDTDRVLSGALKINDARFNIDNFTNNSIRTLNVRWTTDDPDAAKDALLNKPIRLDLDVSATRGVFITGRGLDSDWGVDLDVTGTPDNILLNGRATLARGSLDLAQRPFEFQSGRINFDGPIAAARFALSATREVDGFSVSAEVGGTPSKPTIELSSTPSLPEDEILSRMLFGRSSVDLTALEAAELANSIARLAGQDTGFNPFGALQDELGVDRLRFGIDSSGNAEVGVGQYLAQDVYLEVTTQGAAGNSVEVEWQPRPQVSVASETSSTGESRVSVRWKKDY